MIISYHGHAQFYLEGQNGFSLLTDPYDAHVGYPMKQVRADAVTVSHGHGDHNFVEKVTGTPAIVEKEGRWQVGEDVRVTAIPSFHDDVQGQKRGKNLMMKIEMEGLTLAHLGDLGTALEAEQLAALGQVDVLMIPVGGFYTIDAEEAWEAVKRIQPRMVIPMHYKTAVNADWPIADEGEFLRLAGAEQTQPMPLVRVTKGDLDQQPRVALLQVE